MTQVVTRAAYLERGLVAQPKNLRQQLIGSAARLVRVGDAEDNRLLGLVFRDDVLELGPHRLRRTDDRAPLRARLPRRARRATALISSQELEGPLRRRNRDQLPATQERKCHLPAGR